jgi:hypothetical protein
MESLLFSTPIDDDLAAAVVAAVHCFVEQELPHERSALSPRPAWRAAAALAAQRLPPVRNAAYMRWSAAERASREGHWSYGIVGL